jgi:hypothetical protein
MATPVVYHLRSAEACDRRQGRSIAAKLDFNEIHLERFREFFRDATSWNGNRSPQEWAIRVGANASLENSLSPAKPSREHIKELCADDTISSASCFVAIMAWGGMKYHHGRTIWSLRRQWIPIVDELRAGALSRADAFEKLWTFRRENPRCGMGPAYYTKLIFFAAPQHNGYIMDQWTSLSANLLFTTEQQPMVDLQVAGTGHTRNAYVTDKNNAETYERFCQSIEQLAALFGNATSEQTEQRMFSQGGRNPARWRRYVREHALQIPLN